MDHIKFIENLIANPKKYVKNFSNEELVNLLKMLSDVYYNTENAIVPDETYDKLIDILKNKDPTNEYLKNIGAPIFFKYSFVGSLFFNISINLSYVSSGTIAFSVL